MPPTIVNIFTRPELIPTVAAWLFEAFWRQEGYGIGDVVEALRLSGASAMPQSFVLLVNDQPAGTASLVAQDMEERPDLTPWLAGVFVAPEFRGQGYVARLIKAVEDAARAEAVKTLWLYTSTAETIYARAGWRRTDMVIHNGIPSVLMRRDFS